MERGAKEVPKRKRIGSSGTERGRERIRGVEWGRSEEAREGDKVAADGIGPVVYGSPHVYH